MAENEIKSIVYEIGVLSLIFSHIKLLIMNLSNFNAGPHANHNKKVWVKSLENVDISAGELSISEDTINSIGKTNILEC